MASIDITAKKALEAGSTDDAFFHNEEIFVEVCARWIQSGFQSGAKISAFGRILPLAPHLAEHVERFLVSASQSQILGGQSTEVPIPQDEELLLETLLGTFRLLSYDCRNFAGHVRPLALESLVRHSSRTVRYLAVRTLCIYVHAADHATQEMIKTYVGEGEIEGKWERKTIDYRFLSLWEEKRWTKLQKRLQEKRQEGLRTVPSGLHHQISPYSVNVNGILLPRLDGASSQEKPSDLFPTPTTDLNQRSIAQRLLDTRPLLLTGLPGSGKTLLIRHFAWQLNKLSSMVTLHLNEQSDAKLLVGMYATGAKPGTFSWRPGVLTTAVKEGRWIFIEDLDRAPNEVISTLLPLIERGELLIPSRGETIRAARGFRIIATMRSTLNPKGQEIIPRQNMIGHRFWNSITVHMPKLEEFESIIFAKYPALQKHLSGITRVYSRLLALFSDAKFASENGTSLRALTPRDLLKWCDRMDVLLSQSTSYGPAQVDDIFMEAFDCFAGSLRSQEARHKLMACVAEELHIDPQRRDHLLIDREVKLELPAKSTSAGIIRIGRARLSKHRSPRKAGYERPFSTNDYTLRLLEKVAVAVDRQEPLLLVGETGTGKTTCIQYLADQLGRKLVAFNLSQQSESGDLLGGYKPVNVRSLVIPLKDEFDDLFDTTFSRKKNARFIEMLGKRVAKGEWKRVCVLWREALKMVDAARKAHESQASSPDPEGGQPKKKRKMDSLPADFPKARWEKFAMDLHDLEAQLASGSEAFAFSFLEGNIVKAVRNGDWVLLDEINLASSDTLEALADLLGGGPDGTPSILLTETGNVERVVAHPNFRVFAAMNPATDVGKKDLPPGIRSRFTELYVESPDTDAKSLRNIVEKYLGGSMVDPAIVRIAADVTDLYMEIQKLAKSNLLVDGADQKAHFSLRTLTRTLSYAREIAPLCSLRRALYEGFHMSFLTFLGKASEDLVAPLITRKLLPSAKAELKKPLQQPRDERSYVRQGHYWLRQGVHQVEEQPHYIITPFVQSNMNNLIRAASTRRYPVLIQGPTSSGKTSMIEYLAKRSGNKFVRINNHEHTDLQEYLGSYISGTDGKLTFQEGVLVRALREGHWIVLDELNLAPTDVLEALNRLLDDNRELLIPETQEVVRPHEDFMLFATQNPAGLYGGRKILSRAFRNRFLELHFDDIPVEELTEILHRRTMIPESWCKRIVKVYQELSTLRQENRIFEQKSFATLRDLFRWAQRKADTVQDLANNGYMLLAERVRKEEERLAVKKVLETVMSRNGPKITVDDEKMFSEDSSPEIKLCKEKMGSGGNVVWTRAMRRLFVLVAHALRNNEPVLLVGETGCGKTTVCQMLADAFEKQLHILNAHQNTETGDLIGAQRPIRNRAAIEDLLCRQLIEVLPNAPTDTDLFQLLALYDQLDSNILDAIPIAHREEIQANRVKASALFEWADGSLVHAMKTGQYFLLDEISLADDSVLERLNSVLEPSRKMLLAEKGPIDSLVTASEGFQFLATMNPGGDYGKKELSPALRNRFTEIWVPALSDLEDILQIVQSKLKPAAMPYAGSIVSFSQWFNEKYNTSVSSSISIRDTLAWVTFINNFSAEDPIFGIVHGAAMVFIDTLGANPAGLLAISAASIDDERKACLHRLSKLLGKDVSPLYFGEITVTANDNSLQLGSFSIPRFAASSADANFSLEAPTTRSNCMRVVRALQLSKPILLEGNPGVGKTTLVTAIAKAIGKPLTRLNLSEQTDLMDLFGSDVPVEGGQAGTFAWRDAPFLKAMKNGDWVLLDEMNLASQSVLEGLNAVLDHRGAVYISELDQTFQKHPDFRVFAAQNPHHQGGGRKGLPASFVNRFTVVYADVFRPEDLSLICARIFPSIGEDEVQRLIDFVAELDEKVVNQRTFGALGAPWEFNLRDTLRWLQLLASKEFNGSARDFLDAIFVQRFRSESDRARILKLFEDASGISKPRISLFHNVSPQIFQVGLGLVSRDAAITRAGSTFPLRVPQLGPMEALLISVRQSWPVILVGPPGSGKTAILDQLSSFVGADLVTFSMNADIDAMDLVGGYEQIDPSRELHRFMANLEVYIRRKITSSVNLPQDHFELLEQLTRSGAPSLNDILPVFDTVSASDSEAVQLRKDAQNLLDAPTEIDGARFQWVDGILLRALEQGKWLVLDNANLCSSAVLDRLNSLLEPNGYLSINEHSTADGEARIVKPHPNFRIFMTMDSRFGELSRAMRNRAVEICLLSDEAPAQDTSRIPTYPLDSQMYRFRHLVAEEASLPQTVDVKSENLSTADIGLLQSFPTQASMGLVSVEQELDALDKISHSSRFLSTVWGARAAAIQSELNPTQEFLGDISSTATLHPLNNELAFNLSSQSETLSLWFASVYEVFRDLYNMQQAIHALPNSSLERRKEKQKLISFLKACWPGLAKCMDATWKARQSCPAELGLLKSLRTLFWAFIALAKDSNFERAVFQTFLKMLTGDISSLPDQSIALVTELKATLSKELTVFSSDVQLTSGLGMERIWKYFKPNTPKDQAQLAAILSLESLADRLDATMWKSNLKVSEMVQIRERFASSLELARLHDVDAGELIVALDVAVSELEGNIDEDATVITPYFEEEFEGLCQLLEVAPATPNKDNITVMRAKTSLFARRPTKLSDNAPANTPTGLTSALTRYVGRDQHPAREMALRGRFHIALLEKIRNADEVQLLQLDRFESELQALAQELTLDSDHIEWDQNAALRPILRRVLDHLVESHQDILSGSATSIKVSDQYRKAIEQPIARCEHSADPAHLALAQAWIHLGLTGLSLYIPNYPHDPALRPMIERKLFNEEKSALMEKLRALKQFQLEFTGQETSFRIRQIEEAIQQMGAEPPVPAIVRPDTSELDTLQGEFTNLLSVIQPLLQETMSLQEATHDNTLRQNLAHITKRLVEGYRSYDDITEPAVGFLTCLSIGLALGAQEEQDESNIKRSLQYIVQQTPFFGHKSANDSKSLLRYCEQEFDKKHVVDIRWHTLHTLSIIRSVDDACYFTSQLRQMIHDIFTSFYSDWKSQLLKDQESEAKNTSLYTYRGEDEDGDEEDPSLFPDYEQEQAEPTTPSTSREHAIRVANMHTELFLDARDPSDSLKRLLEWCRTEMTRVSDSDAHGTSPTDALPAIYLAFEQKVDALSSSGTGKGYNFYFDANLPEAKRLIQLIHQIQIRYRQIQKVWPEHATLADVLRTCDEALAFRHVDPVAKFITKAEKLHGYIYEWQRVASRQFNTSNLYDDLTKLLVGWRQLELTTWARLFDIETDKCRDDAKSWFFIAYETIIAASESIEDQASMETHAQRLLKTMEEFFSSTTLGQYEQRIKLLQQLREHLAARMQDVESLKPVHLALSNFITYFSRLEKPVHEALSKGRQNLEKEVNNVIKLASWKDTNIEALKQSAKTSHRKLTKLVRKFRALLNQRVATIYGTGFPEEAALLKAVELPGTETEVDPTALEICAAHVPRWIECPTRFKNLKVTVSMMRNFSTPSPESLDGAEYIDEFITDLEASITQLQKATPTTLTEENKEAVQHLKTRKRKLYADTMKELRQMGIKFNLSSDVLTKQYELSIVLASLPTVSEAGKGAEYFLHKALNIMGQVRDVAKEHSGDLTPNDVARSIGYIEGLLHSTLRQRSVLSKATQSLGSMQQPISLIGNLCDSLSRPLVRVSDNQIQAANNLKPNLSWLVAALRTGADIVAAQAKLGKTNEVDAVIRNMREWSEKFQDALEATARLPILPLNVWSAAHRELDEKSKQLINDFRPALATLFEQYPVSRVVLSHIQPFVFEYSQPNAQIFDEKKRISVEARSEEILKALDLILGSMQDVKTSLQDIPSSNEDEKWLVKEEKALADAVHSLHAPQITAALQTILESMQYLYEDENLRTIAAMFAAVQPILAQYATTHKYLVDRFDALHQSTAKLLHRLSKTFIQIGTQGFCQPPEKSNDPQAGKDDKLESGTGLGEGEGAEDISKDIEEDEDLEDLAQEKNGERENSIENEDDAVDMGEQEMEGEMQDAPEKEDGEEGEEGEEDAQSEVGSVDDLGPSAVDEKMWDEGGKEEDAKEKEGQKDVGTENQDEQVATEKKEDGKEGEKDDKQPEEEEEEMEMEGEDQEENVGMGKEEPMDPHAKEEETLDLPDELNIDGDDNDKEDDLGDMDMDDDLPPEETDADPGAEPDKVDEEIGPEQDGEEEEETTGHIKDDEMEEKEDEGEEGDEPVDDDPVPMPDENIPDEARDTKNDDPSDPNADVGAGADANEEAHKNQQEQASASAANREDGKEGDSSEQKQETNAEDGELGQTAQPDAGGKGEQPEDSPETQSFKKLGDVLEKWYNQQRKISEAKERDETQIQQIEKEVDMADADFEHLRDEEQEADTQALGTATEEQAKHLDEDMGMAVDEEEKMPARPEDNQDPAQDADQDVDMNDTEPKQEQEQEQPQSKTDGQPQAFVGEQKPFTQEDQDMEDAVPLEEDESDTSSVNEVETQLELTHLDANALTSPDEARALWLNHEASTHSLSQQLTEHLRLILAPTLATKLRGDFRTGKRLNLKRIIPYIASGYKRDKIWLRRSQPSKRSYQVMIALDDSKSMAESGASNLALKTLTLVTRSLSMLEVGEVSVVGFGDGVNVAHEFEKPFTSESGVRVFEQFGFASSKTNVRGLVDKSLDLFADARRKGSSSAGEDLWQLMLIVSDGICDSHAEIQRLVRRAQEERVMIVFVIIDSSATPGPAQAGQQPDGTLAEKPKEKTSILDLQSVEISAQGKVVRWKYMERFPFSPQPNTSTPIKMTTYISNSGGSSTEVIEAIELTPLPPRSIKDELEPQAHDSPPDPNAGVPITYPKNIRLALITIGLILSIFLAALDSTILATAIPSITSQFGSISNIAWYGSSYVITNTAFQSAWGKAYNYFSIKRTFLAAIAVFELGNVISAVSSRSEILILGRCVAGMGGGGVMTGSFLGIALSVRDEWRAAYMGVMGVTFGVASVVGPLLGGALVDGAGWRWCFWISLPIGFAAAGIMFFAFRDPISPRQASLKEKIMQTDINGAILITGALSFFVLAMHWAGIYPWRSPRVIGSFVGFGVLFIAFVVNEWLMGSKAMVQAHLMKSSIVLTNSIYAFFLAGAYFPLLYTLPIHFQSVDNSSASQSGVRLIPLVLGISVFTMIANGLITFWRHYRPFLLVGAICSTAGLWLIYSLDAHTPIKTWVGYELLTAIGIGLALQIPMISNQAHVPASEIPSATSLALFMENIGTSLFVASGESAFTQGLVQSLKRNVPSVEPHKVLDAGATQIRETFEGSTLEGVLGGYLDGCRVSYAVCLACGVAACIVAMGGAGPAGFKEMKRRMAKSHET
ncbi:midasin [Corynespora cassiicola Philippines]|uniref:Midasin n=1 Tax=Corynespora cassiicola Philippines TaxID=1448308 RepID=A0A2T2P8I8_CORCC|nr:midasin [Corynespora cassiicola Philippines]